MTVNEKFLLRGVDRIHSSKVLDKTNSMKKSPEKKHFTTISSGSAASEVLANISAT